MDTPLINFIVELLLKLLSYVISDSKYYLPIYTIPDSGYYIPEVIWFFLPFLLGVVNWLLIRCFDFIFIKSSGIMGHFRLDQEKINIIKASPDNNVVESYSKVIIVEDTVKILAIFILIIWLLFCGAVGWLLFDVVNIENNIGHILNKYTGIISLLLLIIFFVLLWLLYWHKRLFYIKRSILNTIFKSAKLDSDRTTPPFNITTSS